MIGTPKPHLRPVKGYNEPTLCMCRDILGASAASHLEVQRFRKGVCGTFFAAVFGVVSLVAGGAGFAHLAAALVLVLSGGAVRAGSAAVFRVPSDGAVCAASGACACGIPAGVAAFAIPGGASARCYQELPDFARRAGSAASFLRVVPGSAGPRRCCC